MSNSRQKWTDEIEGGGERVGGAGGEKSFKTGWNFDPGYLGPSIIILTFNMIIALYTRQRSES